MVSLILFFGALTLVVFAGAILVVWIHYYWMREERMKWKSEIRQSNKIKPTIKQKLEIIERGRFN